MVNPACRNLSILLMPLSYPIFAENARISCKIPVVIYEQTCYNKVSEKTSEEEDDARQYFGTGRP